jgi:hypothetical protein
MCRERAEVALAYELEEFPGGEPGEEAAGPLFADSRFGYGFTIGGYDRSLPLVLDPMILVYCGFVGGTGNESANGIAVDDSGHAYIVGETDSTQASFPVVVGPDLSYNGEYDDVFVAKVAPGGANLVYCGYIGGSDTEYGSGIAVDGSGYAYVSGWTVSAEPSFPARLGPDVVQNGGQDAFVAMVSSYELHYPVFDGHDYDGDGTSDISQYRPSNGVWYVSGQSDTPWGVTGDIPVPGKLRPRHRHRDRRLSTRNGLLVHTGRFDNPLGNGGRHPRSRRL